MANKNPDWEALGRNVQRIVDDAVSSRNFEQLNQTIRQTVERAVDMGEDIRRAVEENRRSRPVREAADVTVESKNLPALYGSPNGTTAKGILKMGFGGALSLASAVLVAVTVLADVGIGLLVSLGALVGSVWMTVSGVKNVEFASRFKKYRKALGKKTHCALDTLAQSVGKNEKFVRRELEAMIEKGLFRQGHLDNEGSTLITSDETYRYFERSRLELEQRRQEEAAERERQEKLARTHSPQVREVLDKGEQYIQQIRRCNDAIPGEEISRKITRMELIVDKIFDRAETHPEIIPDLKKLMDYYLPMSVKLLNAYADMDAQPVQGENILSAKREIEETLDTLNLAFEKLLDQVFADTALDISSDISVLQTLLAQEGLTEDGFDKIKRS